MKRKFYLAYGANTNRSSMLVRCPAAQFVGVRVVPRLRMVFRGPADIIDSKGAQLHVALWSITESCEHALDIFEGFPRLYVKRYVNIDVAGVRHRAMFYVMRTPVRAMAEPREFYYKLLEEGYEDCGMSPLQIQEALAYTRAAIQRQRRSAVPAAVLKSPPTWRPYSGSTTLPSCFTKPRERTVPDQRANSILLRAFRRNGILN